jgi:microcin C transport system substrate-binding protein
MKLKIYCIAVSCLFMTPFIKVKASEATQLPSDLKWETNNSDPLFCSPEAQKGGTFKTHITTFPLTLRYIGPDSNGSFRGFINGNRMALTAFHPNTKNVIPSLATHWAYKGDNKTVYYKLDKSAKWSDGKPITADDYLFTLEMMRSKHIVAPWYNNHYNENFDKVVKFDDYTIAIISTKQRTKRELHYHNGLAPTPKHFVKLDKDFIKRYNWKYFPNTGAYQIDEIRKGKYITFKRKKNWWGEKLTYAKNCFNVNKVKITVIRDLSVAYEHFKKGNIDSFSVTLPDYWYKKTKDKNFDNGYIHKAWFYNDSERPNYGMWMNLDKWPFQDINVRKALSHSMNINKVINTVLRGDYERLQNGYTGYGPYTNKSIRARKFDLNKAEEYFKKAGWDKRGDDGIRVKDGKRMSISITYGVPHHQDRLVILKEEAKKAGVELKLRLMDGATSFKSILEKQHEIAYMGWSPGFLAPSYWQMIHSDNAHKPQTNNISNMDNKELDKLIMKYRNTFKEKDRVKLSNRIQEIIFEQAAYIPTFLIPYFREAYWAYWKFPKVPATRSSDSLFNPFGMGNGAFWVDMDLKKEIKKAKRKRKKLEPKTMIFENFKK